MGDGRLRAGGGAGAAGRSGVPHRFSALGVGGFPGGFSGSPVSVARRENGAFRPRRGDGGKTLADGAVSGVGATVALPGIVVSLVGAVAVIGVTSGIIPTPPTNHVSVFMSRSTELGFEIDRDPNKSYVMYLYNEENSYFNSVLDYATKEGSRAIKISAKFILII